MSAVVEQIGFEKPDDALRAWRALRYFSLYRLVIAGLFVVLGVAETLPPPLGSHAPALFSWAAWLILAMVEGRVQRYRLQLFAQICVDITMLTLMMHASGGVESGLGILIVVAVASGSLLASGRMAVLLAATASLAVLLETSIATSFFGSPAGTYTQAGMLGAAMFGTALLSYLLAERVRESEALAARQAVDIVTLSRLNEHIVQRMRSGVVVLDADNRIVLINESARGLLGIASDVQGLALEQVAPVLVPPYIDWLNRGVNSSDPVSTDESNIDVMASFAGLGDGERSGHILFLEDAGEMRQRAQQLKLASLGRLAASIAHEIRNPLGAISHAGQLLSESPALGDGDKRLTAIIDEHSKRMNTIIENVLTVGRRDSSVPENFDLIPWLHELAAEFRERRELKPEDVVVDAAAEIINVRMDRSQLRQVVWNLGENALRYSTGTPLLSFEPGIMAETQRPYLDVIDTGPGISAADAEQVFEPFFTGQSRGTGLGLYIAREFCESNQATLTLREHGPGGCCFRIIFAHPERRQLTT